MSEYRDDNGHSLGDILATALAKQERETMQFTIKQERVVTVATTTFRPPEWVRLALDGQKINAIKSLRDDIARRDQNGQLLGLAQAKDIVESITANISTRNAVV